MTTTSVSKSDFIRQQPADMSASQVIEKGKEAKLKITPSLVYGVRADQKKKAGKTVTKIKTNGGPVPQKAEAVLLAVAAEIGLKNAIEFLQSHREIVVKMLS